jgi:hypothetical protein
VAGNKPESSSKQRSPFSRVLVEEVSTVWNELGGFKRIDWRPMVALIVVPGIVIGLFNGFDPFSTLIDFVQVGIVFLSFLFVVCVAARVYERRRFNR